MFDLYQLDPYYLYAIVWKSSKSDNMDKLMSLNEKDLILVLEKRDNENLVKILCSKGIGYVSEVILQKL